MREGSAPRQRSKRRSRRATSALNRPAQARQWARIAGPSIRRLPAGRRVRAAAHSLNRATDGYVCAVRDTPQAPRAVLGIKANGPRPRTTRPPCGSARKPGHRIAY
jgi:hypothetical protein